MPNLTTTAAKTYPQTLSGRTIAVPESRSLAVFTQLLERRGATVLACPLVGIHNTPNSQDVLDWVKRFNAGEMDDLILMTGEGLRRIQSIIQIHSPELQQPFVARLANVRKITRGPKPNSELRKLGLERDINASAPTTEGVIHTLKSLDLQQRRVGLQLYGDYDNPPLQNAIRELGGQVDTVAPYIYASDSEEQKVAQLVTAISQQSIDAIAFTSATQVTRLFAVAKKIEQSDGLLQGLNSIIVAAVGPVVRDALQQKNVQVQHMPETSFFLKPLVKLLGEKLGPT